MLIAILLILIGAGWCGAQSNLDSLIDRAPGLETYPQASLIRIFERRVTIVDSAGLCHERSESLWKIVAERAKDRYGDRSVTFDADRDTVIIEAARTRLPNGTWIEPEKDAFTITSAPEVQWASAYSQLKQQNVSMPGLDVGAAMYFAYRTEPKRGVKPPRNQQPDGITLFGGPEPTLEKLYSVEVADNHKIRYEVQNASFDPEIAHKNGRTIYTWLRRDCPQIVTEPNTVSTSYLVPWLVWTAFADWEALGLFISEYFWEKVDSSQTAVDGYFKITSPELKGIPALMNAANWTLWNIRTVHLPLGAVGYEPNSADRVWQNRYGDPRDKAVLLTAILRAYGFGPIPVLVQGGMTPFSELPAITQFHDIILAVPTGEDTVWLDPTADHYPPGVLPYSSTYGRGCLLTAGAPTLIKVPAGPDNARGANNEIRTVLRADGSLSGSVTTTPLADNAAAARATFKDQKPQERDTYLQNIASRIAQGTTVTEFSVSDVTDLAQPVVVKLGFESPQYAVRQGDLLLVELPSAPFDFARAGLAFELPQVKYPVRLPYRRRVTTDFSLTVPDGFTVTYLPAPFMADNACVRVEVMPRLEKQSVFWSQIIEVKADSVAVADYAAVRAAVQMILLPKNRLMILEEKKP